MACIVYCRTVRLKERFEGEGLAHFFDEVRAALRENDVDAKLALVRGLRPLLEQGLPDAFGEIHAVHAPGRPERPLLVHPSKLPRRKVSSAEGRAVMLHAIVHIEFNAINLALDAVQRFPGMPEQFYSDWLRVAEEEVYHFEILRGHLRHLGGEYGDHAAHNGLWEMAEKTAGDVLHRMALVPRVLEARGLDVTPGIQNRLRQAGDLNAASLLDIIFRDEVGHVEIGSRWFHFLCEQRGLEPATTFFALVDEYFPDGLHGPYSVDARRSAGFSERELDLLLGAQSASFQK